MSRTHWRGRPLTPAIAALLSLGGVSLVWGYYLSSIPRNRVPENPALLVALQGGFVLGAAAAFGWAVAQDTWKEAALWAPCLGAFGFGGLFLYVMSLRRTPLGELSVGPGDAILDFETTSSTGEPWRSADLRGRWLLIKFYRGSW